ncbi:hypothetical protein BDK51DRAFT_52926 [Blyttiomyces helicus]|uniref:Uncharacterized protein n=1 Tax=Blyttiomyces helicus TaxID=388810 RepID=A0A4P9W3R8_9FUNG|nr:hypothetical protein BDK51DRAFT_52926 [Blyttiomyces helicus]|eukprot:RKO86971.1 hypothetical protein BDK51DRAFT_52926 [Blyttiomyces helicus]
MTSSSQTLCPDDELTDATPELCARSSWSSSSPSSFSGWDPSEEVALMSGEEGLGGEDAPTLVDPDSPIMVHTRWEMMRCDLPKGAVVVERRVGGVDAARPAVKQRVESEGEGGEGSRDREGDGRADLIATHTRREALRCELPKGAILVGHRNGEGLAGPEYEESASYDAPLDSDAIVGDLIALNHSLARASIRYSELSSRSIDLRSQLKHSATHIDQVDEMYCDIMSELRGLRFEENFLYENLAQLRGGPPSQPRRAPLQTPAELARDAERDLIITYLRDLRATLLAGKSALPPQSPTIDSPTDPDPRWPLRSPTTSSPQQPPAARAARRARLLASNARRLRIILSRVAWLERHINDAAAALDALARHSCTYSGWIAAASDEKTLLLRETAALRDTREALIGRRARPAARSTREEWAAAALEVRSNRGPASAPIDDPLGPPPLIPWIPADPGSEDDDGAGSEYFTCGSDFEADQSPLHRRTPLPPSPASTFTTPTQKRPATSAEKKARRHTWLVPDSPVLAPLAMHPAPPRRKNKHLVSRDVDSGSDGDGEEDEGARRRARGRRVRRGVAVREE